jgi:nitroimidazol reductase NimA-like FMN-containing flavoprotein (pyridoxamine 5'-phosphate oxidase superfamily)
LGFKLDIAMTQEELDSYLSTQRAVRIATMGPNGPHNVPYWFAWHDGCIFFNTTLGNLAVKNIERDGRASATVDDGFAYEELRGVTLNGRIVPVPRSDPRIPEVEAKISAKYLEGNPVPYANWKSRHWFCLVPERVMSWDFARIPAARAKRDAERAAEGG